MKKKLIIFIIVMIVLAAIITVIYISSEKNKTVNLVVGDNQESIELSMKDFICEYDKMSNDFSNEYFSVGFTNNSKYDILGIKLFFSSKASDTPIEAEKNILIKRGKKIEFQSMYPEHQYWVGGEDIEVRKKKYEDMEPSTLILRIVSDDFNSYLVSYDFTNKEWSNLNKYVKLSVMEENELAKKLIEPDCKYYRFIEDEAEEKEIDKSLGIEDRISILCYDISLEEFDKYVNKIKEAGFIDNASLNDFDYYAKYDAENAEGNEIYIMYFEDDKKMLIGIIKKLMGVVEAEYDR